VWIDIFAKNELKTIWLTLLQSSVPLGVVTGYGVTAIFDSEFGTWRYSYYAQAVVYFFLLIMFICIPKEYIEDDKEDDNQESEVGDISDFEPKSNKMEEMVDVFDDGYDGYDSEEVSEGGYS